MLWLWQRKNASTPHCTPPFRIHVADCIICTCLFSAPQTYLLPLMLFPCVLTFVSFLLCVQGLTVEDVCKQLRRLYVVKNFSLEHSVSITCDPSFSASNEIHVCIVSTSSYSQSAICFSASIDAYSKTLIYSLQRAFLATISCSKGCFVSSVGSK